MKKILPAKSYKLRLPFLSNLRKGGALFGHRESPKRNLKIFSKKGLHF